MEDLFEGIVNYNIAAKKRGDSVIFLRKIVRGGTDDSYGIEVAKLAGVPGEVVKRAREILSEIEKGNPSQPSREKTRDRAESTIDMFSSLINSKENEAAEKIRGADINTMTPIEAMNLLYEIKKLLS
jgi:DNA mismatch repair protein MutS